MSSLTVTLEPVTEPVEADPAGFTDGLTAGWNGLVATLNGIVIALGFLLPWLVVIAIAGAHRVGDRAGRPATPGGQTRPPAERRSAAEPIVDRCVATVRRPTKTARVGAQPAGAVRGHARGALRPTRQRRRRRRVASPIHSVPS